jgi:hypothetical protein
MSGIGQKEKLEDQKRRGLIESPWSVFDEDHGAFEVICPAALGRYEKVQGACHDAGLELR